MSEIEKQETGIMKKLNFREERFIAEYQIDLDPQRAAIAAGYSKTVAMSAAYQWVTDSPKNPKPHVYAELRKQFDQRIQKTEITIEKIEEELSVLAFGKAKGELTASDKLKALELLGKRRGMFKEAVEVNGPLAAIQIVIPDNGRERNLDDGQ